MSLSRNAVAEILGPVDDTLAVDLIATGATRRELAAAKHWLDNDEVAPGGSGRFPDARVSQLVEILRASAVIPEDLDRTG